MSGTVLKVIALISMFIDHLWFFLPDMPYCFHWIGRISFPIFLYCCVLGYVHTSNRKRYFLRIYSLSVIVGLINFLWISKSGINLNSIRTIFITLILMYIYEQFKQNLKKGSVLAAAFLGWQVITSFLVIWLAAFLTDAPLFMIVTVLGNILNLDGGILFALLGLSMYVFYRSRLKLTIAFIIITLIDMTLVSSPILPYLSRYLMWNGQLENLDPLVEAISSMLFGVNPLFTTSDILFGYPQWMMIFALPIIFLYNGTKGRGCKYLFYVFYPLHIVVLYAIRLLLY